MPDEPTTIEESYRLLILAPNTRDGEIAREQLAHEGILGDICSDDVELCDQMLRGAGAVLLTEDQLTHDLIARVGHVLRRQPAWSDFPFLVVGNRGRHGASPHLERLGNVALLDAPLRVRTMLRAAHAALRSRRRQYAARKAIEERDRFLAMLGHELRNPLSAISLATQVAVLKQGMTAHQLQIVQRQVEHLTRLVDDLLDVARVTSGRIALQRQPIELQSLLTRLVDSLHANFREACVDIDLASTAPGFVLADQVRLEQVFVNLLTNALKYTPSGGTVTVKLAREGDGLRASITDTGVGMTAEFLPRLFEPFVQAESTLARAQGGMGVGLALVRTLVELHGGWVRAHSAGLGQGSEFVVYLPACQNTEIADSVATRGDNIAPCDNRTLVVVEDNPHARELLTSALEHYGHRVQSASDGESGLALVVAEQPDAAIVDIGLPKLDGYELARKVRGLVDRPLLLIALTGYGQPGDRRRAIDAGFDFHLTKPADVDAIQALLVPRSE